MKFVFYANTDWYLYNFRLSTALRLKSEGHDVVMLSPPGEYGERFESHGLRWIQLASMDRASLNPLREAATIRDLTRVLKHERPDLLHNFTVKCAIYGAIAARAAGVPAVVNAVAGMGYVFSSERILARSLRPIVKLLMRGTLGGKGTRLILQNPDDADAFVRARLVPQQQIRVIRSSGVNLERFLPVDPYAEARPLRVLLAARLLWEKGIGEYIESARLLRAQGRTIEFVIAGSPDPGNPRSVSREQAESWVAEGLVDWRGHVEDMPALMRSMDVIALPSYYREGVPRAGSKPRRAAWRSSPPTCRAAAKSSASMASTACTSSRDAHVRWPTASRNSTTTARSCAASANARAARRWSISTSRW